jgi:O-succinylbenzoic acid--CoA ligase
MRVVDGQVLLGGPTLAEGYLDADGGLDAERSAAAFVSLDGERWYRTGDAGVVEDGRLSVTGRLDRVIVSGGEKVSLDAVERVLRDGLVPDAVVVRRRDAQWGEVPVVATEAADVDLALLRSAVVERLGRAAGPAAVLAVAEIPLLASGKPDRRALETLAAAGEV